jgi:hypothetical protein
MSRSSRINTLARTLADRFSQDIHNREQFLPMFSFDLPLLSESIIFMEMISLMTRCQAVGYLNGARGLSELVKYGRA